MVNKLAWVFFFCKVFVFLYFLYWFSAGSVFLTASSSGGRPLRSWSWDGLCKGRRTCPSGHPRTSPPSPPRTRPPRSYKDPSIRSPQDPSTQVLPEPARPSTQVLPGPVVHQGPHQDPSTQVFKDPSVHPGHLQDLGLEATDQDNGPNIFKIAL